MAPTRDRKAFVHQDDAAKGRPGRDGARRSACGDARRRRAPAATEGAAREDQCQSRKIFIGGLSSDTTTEDLRLHFARFGALADAVVLQWADGRSRGFGYVTFEEASAVAAVLRTRHALGGRPVDVKRAVPGTNKLFVGGLPQNATAAELREHFEAYGVVSDAVVMIDPSTSRSRGFGFVCFCPGQEGASALAMALEQYQSHRIRGKWIEVKSAAPPHKLGQEAAGCAAPQSAAVPPVEEWALPDAAGALPLLMGAPPPWLCPATASALAMQSGPVGFVPHLLGRAEPQKVALPAKAPEVIGTPPGLDGMDGKLTPRMAWDPSGGGVAAVPWPCLHAAAAPWALHSLGPDLHDPEAPGEWDCPASKPWRGAASEPAPSEGLQRSLEQLLKLRLCEPPEAPEAEAGPSPA
mmetsp:Transcript_21485/g.56024  ORF Transcript_21485/g.56024 Transcript_21485/m.56024 type:complete len:409 (+) Transcript_21485:138-1364(+)